MEKNVTDMIGYAFQIYALFVANSVEITNNYKVLTESILSNKGNWDKDMKYLIPALANFLIAMIYKYPQFIAQFADNLQNIVNHLMSPDIRMEQTAMQIGSAVFEKLGATNEGFLNSFLYSVFSCLHFYRNNTKTKIIPVPISKSVWSCFANFMIYNGTQALVNACNKV